MNNSRRKRSVEHQNFVALSHDNSIYNCGEEGDGCVVRETVSSQHQKRLKLKSGSTENLGTVVGKFRSAEKTDNELTVNARLSDHQNCDFADAQKPRSDFDRLLEQVQKETVDYMQKMTDFKIAMANTGTPKMRSVGLQVELVNIKEYLNQVTQTEGKFVKLKTTENAKNDSFNKLQTSTNALLFPSIKIKSQASELAVPSTSSALSDSELSDLSDEEKAAVSLPNINVKTKDISKNTSASSVPSHSPWICAGAIFRRVQRPVAASAPLTSRFQTTSSTRNGRPVLMPPLNQIYDIIQAPNNSAIFVIQKGYLQPNPVSTDKRFPVKDKPIPNQAKLNLVPARPISVQATTLLQAAIPVKAKPKSVQAKPISSQAKLSSVPVVSIPISVKATTPVQATISVKAKPNSVLLKPIPVETTIPIQAKQIVVQTEPVSIQAEPILVLAEPISGRVKPISATSFVSVETQTMPLCLMEAQSVPVQAIPSSIQAQPISVRQVVDASLKVENKSTNVPTALLSTTNLTVAIANPISPANLTAVAPKSTPTAINKVDSARAPIQEHKKTQLHPAPLPSNADDEIYVPGRKQTPPKPDLRAALEPTGIALKWNLELTANHSPISSYELYCYHAILKSPKLSSWKKLDDIEAITLPISCILQGLKKGRTYFFAVRAVDIYSRLGPFSKSVTFTV